MGAILFVGLLVGGILGFGKPPKDQDKTIVLRNGHAENSLTERLHAVPADVVIDGYPASK